MSQLRDTCPVCDLPKATVTNIPNRDAENVECPNCGEFIISGNTRPFLEDLRNVEKAVIAHKIWRNQSKNDPPLIHIDVCKAALEEYPNGFTTLEKLDKFILYLGERDRYGLRN